MISVGRLNERRSIGIRVKSFPIVYIHTFVSSMSNKVGEAEQVWRVFGQDTAYMPHAHRKGSLTNFLTSHLSGETV